MDAVFALFGIPLDPEKADDLQMQLTILGVLVQPKPRDGQVLVQITRDKAERWGLALAECLEQSRCDPGTSGKLAGRLQFACTVAADKVGRAFIAPFHAQSHAPLHQCAISQRWRRAAEWWRRYLQLRPPVR